MALIEQGVELKKDVKGVQEKLEVLENEVQRAINQRDTDPSPCSELRPVKQKLDMDQLKRSPLKQSCKVVGGDSQVVAATASSSATSSGSSGWVMSDRVKRRIERERREQTRSQERVEWSPLKADCVEGPCSKKAVRKRLTSSCTCYDCDKWFGMDHGCVHKTRREHEKKTLRHSEKYGYITPPDSKIWDISWPSSDKD